MNVLSVYKDCIITLQRVVVKLLVLLYLQQKIDEWNTLHFYKILNSSDLIRDIFVFN